MASSLHSGTTAQGLWIIHSVDHCILKSNYYLNDEPLYQTPYNEA